MLCPNCSSPDTKVIDSRTSKDNQSIRRRRQCMNCGHRFSTAEAVIREGINVLKRDDTIEEFDQKKLHQSVKQAFHKRPIESERISVLVNEVIHELERKYEMEIPTHAIAEGIMNKINLIDKVAYVRYASAYRKFTEA